MRTPAQVSPQPPEHRRRLRSVAGVSALAVTAALCLVSTPAAVAADGAQSSAAPVQATFYVSPQGKDSNSGLTRGSAFKTLEKGRTAARALAGDMSGDIVVNLTKGEYYTPETVEFDQADSGTNGFSVVYRSSDGPGAAKLIGGTKVKSEWQLVSPTTPGAGDADLPTSAVGKVYETKIGAGLDFNTLYVNDERATMARTPSHRVEPRFTSAQNDYMVSTGGNLTSLNYPASGLDEAQVTALVNAQNRGDLNAQIFGWDGAGWDWMTSTIPIGSIDAASRKLSFVQIPGQPGKNRPHFSYGGGARFLVQGNIGLLDEPGEYYYNKSSGYLYYYPQADAGSIAKHEVVVPTTEKIVDVTGASRTEQVSHITFDGLAFKDTNFPEYYSYAWNAHDARGPMGFPDYAMEPGITLPSYAETSERPEFQVGSITLKNTNNITITNAHVKNSGLFGIELYEANDHTMISNSLIENTGHGGVNIEGGFPGVGGDAEGNGYSNNNTVTNTIIHDIGQLVGQTAGVSINNASYNTVSHSEIYNSPRRALLLMGGYGRTSGPGPTGDGDYNRMTDLYAHHNTFSHLYIHDAENDGADDGAIFTFDLFRAKQHKPNTFDQIVIDKIGSTPTMDGIPPNSMNLDVGAAGVVVKNFQGINPQQYNAEVNTIVQYGDQITFENTNINYGRIVNQLADFDPSKMDYANIGANDANPYFTSAPGVEAAKKVYFEDTFEGAALDASKWRWEGIKPAISHEFTSEGVTVKNKGGVDIGKGALVIDGDKAAGSKPVLFRDFGTALKKQTVTVDIFDRQSSGMVPYDSGAPISANVKSLVRVDNGGDDAIGLGIDTSVSRMDYVFQNGSEKIVTEIPRTYGWHTLTFDYSDGRTAVLSIDGVEVGTVQAPSFQRVQLGSADEFGDGIYDQVRIVSATKPGAAETLPVPLSLDAPLSAADAAKTSGVTTGTTPDGAAYAGPLAEGAYLEYVVDVAKTGAYSIDYRVAVDAGATGGVELLVDGKSASQTALDSTGGLQDWATASDVVTLTSGIHTLRLQSTAGGWNFQSAKLAYVAQSIPGTIQAVSYDSKTGGIQPVEGEGGSAIGYISVNDTMSYKVVVGATGVYDLSYRAAVNKFTNNALEMQVDGVPVAKTVLPLTGGWTNWGTATDTVSLTEGMHTITLRIADNNNFNVQSFTLSLQK
ncbi:carbohydrate-binding protein [Arthrobacter sp. HY1533]|uniref:carbohydrate-binding protein n=1 Tax=Arthrobacter sp. HY1533 TaxID=2970919 RepID=UPI0022BA07E8|nr:carbohydrate-binding protein [Arthrobacter sp. HY1533]